MYKYAKIKSVLAAVSGDTLANANKMYTQTD